MAVSVDPMEMILKQGKEWAIKEGYTPTGRKLGVGQVANTALCRLQYVDSKPSRMHPPYDGMYTKPTLAREDLDKYLREFWEMSEKESQKKRRSEFASRVVALEDTDAVSAG
jgi:hypothetical protein